MAEWGNQEALKTVLDKKIAYYEMMNLLQIEINKLEVTEQTLKETLGLSK